MAEEKRGVKTVLVTGASDGIGAAVCRTLLESGHNVVMIARRREKMQALAERFGEDRAHIYSADLSELDAASGMFQEILRDVPQLDTAIHNAGSAVFGPLEEIRPIDWRYVLDLNLNAAYAMAHALIPQFRELGRGHFLFMNSVASDDIFPGGILYGTSKSALRAFADHLREDLRKDRIAVTSIFPAATATPWWDSSGQDTSTMIQTDDLARQILCILEQPLNAVIEEVKVRRVEGNF